MSLTAEQLELLLKYIDKKVALAESTSRGYGMSFADRNELDEITSALCSSVAAGGAA